MTDRCGSSGPLRAPGFIAQSTGQAGSNVAGMRVVARNRVPSNNALERTRRVGVPAARAIVRVSPCRSTRCSTGIEMISERNRRTNEAQQ